MFKYLDNRNFFSRSCADSDQDLSIVYLRYLHKVGPTRNGPSARLQLLSAVGQSEDQNCSHFIICSTEGQSLCHNVSLKALRYFQFTEL